MLHHIVVGGALSDGNFDSGSAAVACVGVGGGRSAVGGALSDSSFDSGSAAATCVGVGGGGSAASRVDSGLAVLPRVWV